MPYVEVPEPSFGEFPDSSYRQFESLVGISPAKAASVFGMDLTPENIEDGWFDVDISDNEIFEQISVLFDMEDETPLTSCVMMRCKRGIEQEHLEPWYREHYTSTGDQLNPYYNEEGKFYVNLKKVGSRLYVYYQTFKSRK